MSKQEPNFDTVVIVTGRASHSRCYKIAYGLKICNYKVILLHSDRGFSFYDEEIKSLFDEILIYNSPEDALIKAIKYRPIAYHILCNWNYDVAEFFIQVKPGVVVVDTFDVIAGFVRPDILRNYSIIVNSERFCLENSDGLCCRDLRTQYLKRHLEYRLSTRLLWPEYCWATGFIVKRSERLADKHVVYVGGMELNPDSPTAFQYDLALLLSKAGIHFHIYPWQLWQVPELKSRMSNVVPTELMKYVHVHVPVSVIDLAKELRSYHVGVSIWNFDNCHDTYQAFMDDYLLTSKLFDYHEAGLLCLTQKMRLATHIFSKSRAVREVKSLEEIVGIVSKMEIHEIEADPKLRIDYHAHRLPEFYLRLYNQRLKRAGS